MSTATLGAGALKGAKVGGQKSSAKGSASGNVSVGGFNPPAFSAGNWQPIAIVAGALVVVGVAFVMLKK